MILTRRLRAEHEHLMVGVEELRQAGDLVGTASHDAAQDAAERAGRFVRERLLPHARSEEEFLYPAVARALGSLRATRTMVRDHAEVKRLSGELWRALEEHDQTMTRRMLYGLYHVILLHFAKEEEIYLPLLEESLDEATAEELWRQMQAA